MAGTLQNKAKARQYQKLGNSGALEFHAQTNGTSYQNSTEYALPPKQKVVTYCVIDGRLVDQ
jgi:hypothetical protein